MKLYHLGLWMLTVPAFVAIATPQLTGTVYVNARFVTTPCQPYVTLQRAINYASDPVYQFKISFAHCMKTKQSHQRLPFSLKLGSEKLVFSTPLTNNTVSFLVPSNNSAHRLEMSYD
ncbi:hypothetical protein [Providencia heimbachae]|uniref:Uncharacterized protein n=1 Tax=Providencia heimbachae ATCC 35613 TaxID=1354272 RepID=A0A1B7JP97_9GAMM|nr:hypothetical protein [Providencia heimbachae]MDD9338661.1 hypothetical protein [Providencia heimbachae]OAT49739.1 hypothetical protein M998_2904 [Providencia heimbachae ATCC 35613]QCJ69088.1 hypothetical protein C9446_03895 [Providencia heimbachae]SQH12129.1 Uncharacterised protein [Providencia heimbachae]